MNKIIIFMILSLLFVPLVSAELSSDFFFDDNWLYDLDTLNQPVEFLYVEGRTYPITPCDCFIFDINRGDSVREITYWLGRESPPTRNTSFTAYYIKPLDDMLFVLWENPGMNNTLGPKILGNLSIIGTDCTNNPTCYASNLSSIIRNGSYEMLIDYIRPDTRFYLGPRSNYLNENTIVFRTRNTNTGLERITIDSRIMLSWDTSYLVNATDYTLVFTSPNHDVKGFYRFNTYLDSDNTLGAMLILLSVFAVLLLFFAWVTPDYYTKLVLLFIGGFFLIINFMTTNSFWNESYFKIATFITVAYSVLGMVLLGLFVYLFFSIGLLLIIIPFITKLYSKRGGNAKK